MKLKLTRPLMPALSLMAIFGCMYHAPNARSESIDQIKQSVAANSGVYVMVLKAPFFTLASDQMSSNLQATWKLLTAMGVQINRIDVILEGSPKVLYSYSTGSGLIRKE